LKTCNCTAFGKPDYLDHQPGCPFFAQSVRVIRDAAVQELLDTAKRVDDLAERLANLPVGGGVNHKIANIRMMLLGEAFRLRKAAHQIKTPFEKMSASGA